jgi:hypothetical protein
LSCVLINQFLMVHDSVGFKQEHNRLHAGLPACTHIPLRDRQMWEDGFSHCFLPFWSTLTIHMVREIMTRSVRWLIASSQFYRAISPEPTFEVDFQ